VLGDTQREVELQAGTAGWLPAQRHHGENIGETPSHALFVELKQSSSPREEGQDGAPLGPA
jgi:hypothetical protein